MRAIKTNSKTVHWLQAVAVAAVALLGSAAQAAAPGITGVAGTSGPVFNLDAAAAYISQPDGTSVYSWGYGCAGAQGVAFAGFAPATIAAGNCPAMQLPGPTLVVTEGQTVTVNLTNALPTAAGNTSMLFPGFTVTATGGVAGPLTKEAAPGGTVSYSFVASSPGTHSYYSGTQSDLQIEMGLYGAIIVLPSAVPAACTGGLAAKNVAVELANGEADFRHAASAYDHASTCYDREYLFQFSEMDLNIHNQVQAQVAAKGACLAGAVGCSLNVQTEPYHPTYFMINGRSMPDDMDPNYAPAYPNQPYNGNPHMHPGELTLLRIIGQGRWQHPFHEHGNHVRVLARDGNLLVSASDATKLAGPLMFTTTTTPGQAMDGIFQWTGKGLNWDVFAHGYAGDASTCTPDVNGYNTAVSTATAADTANYYEWCGDHNKPLEKAPFGAVGGGGPISLPDPNIVTNGPWYSGTAYLGPDAALRATGATAIPPSGTIANNSGSEAGFAYMWHSHNEREITTGNIFPGGMLMMMLVDPRAFQIDESN